MRKYERREGGEWKGSKSETGKAVGWSYGDALDQPHGGRGKSVMLSFDQVHLCVCLHQLEATNSCYCIPVTALRWLSSDQEQLCVASSPKSEIYSALYD